MNGWKNTDLARGISQALGTRHTLALSCLLLMACSGAADAQTATPAGQGDDTIDEVVVTGFRGSLQTSIAEKREADQIVESISAEDIGKLPDNSIAESIARAPGLTTQRLDGRAQVISIRGLAPDFSTTLLNGREQVSTGDNRSAEYDQYPAELLSAVVIYKTPQAGLIGQGLSGTVDLRTVRPLTYGKRTLAGNVRGETLSLGKLNAGSEDTGYRVSGSYIDQFADDKIGVAFGVAHMSSPTQIEKFNAWGYPEIAPGQPRIFGGAKPYVISTELERTGVIGTIEYQPTENFNTALDVYYSKFKDDQVLRGVEFPLLWGGLQPNPGFSASNGIVTDGEFDGVKGVVRNDANRRDAELWTLGWSSELTAGAWTFLGDVNYSHVEREDIILETYSGTGRRGIGATDNLGFHTSEPGVVRFDSGLDYADPNLIQLTSPQGWGDGAIPGGQDGFINNPSIEDELTAFRVSVGRELGSIFKNVDVGVNYTLRDKDYAPDRFYLGLAANASDPGNDLSVPIPSGALLRPTRLGFLGIPGMVSYDPIKLAYSGIYNFVPAADAAVYSRQWKVTEDVLTGFAMIGIDTDLGASTLTGNIGVQLVNTDQTSDGATASGAPIATVSPITVEQDYTETLPSLNLSLRMPSDLIFRLGAARQLARPRMDDMRASISYGYDPSRAGSSNVQVSPWSGEGGNPHLKPWIADALDLSVEKYFGRDGYVSGAVFYKDLKTYIYTQTTLYDFAGFPVLTGGEPVLRQGFVSTPQNAEGGEIYGYEVAATLSFGTFTPLLDGFGVTSSYSYTKSNIQPDPTNPARPIPGLSQDVVNTTLYFEKSGFSARASMRYRSEFLAEVQGVGGERLLRMAKGERLVDAQVSYDFQGGSMQGLTLLLQGSNLTDEPFITHELIDGLQVIDHQIFGRRYLFGASYKY
jgi:iron complex outermembrane recepter protein